MKVETLSFQEILSFTPDVFEAVVVAGHRAQQINDRRTAERVDIIDEFIEEDLPVNDPIEEENYIEEEKPTVLAFDDFLKSKLTWRYADPDADEPGE